VKELLNCVGFIEILLHALVNAYFMRFAQVPLPTVQPFYTQKEPGRSMLAAHMQFSGGFFNGKLNLSCRFCLWNCSAMVLLNGTGYEFTLNAITE